MKETIVGKPVVASTIVFLVCKKAGDAKFRELIASFSEFASYISLICISMASIMAGKMIGFVI